ncbi:hypothetical protein A2U01_0075120, partial [Trifolium medium]|nr:hypothetical protein [Trifolium medium]
ATPPYGECTSSVE